MKQKSPSDLSGHPRTYGMDRATRRFARSIALCLVLIAMIGIIGQSAGMIHRSLSPTGLVFLGVTLGGIAVVIWVGTGRRVIIHADTIQVTGWAGARALTRDQILGWRMGHGGRFGDTPFYIVVPRNRTERELKLPLYLKTDRLFQDWMNSIPRVNAE